MFCRVLRFGKNLELWSICPDFKIPEPLACFPSHFSMQTQLSGGCLTVLKCYVHCIHSKQGDKVPIYLPFCSLEMLYNIWKPPKGKKKSVYKSSPLEAATMCLESLNQVSLCYIAAHTLPNPDKLTGEILSAGTLHGPLTSGQQLSIFNTWSLSSDCFSTLITMLSRASQGDGIYDWNKEYFLFSHTVMLVCCGEMAFPLSTKASRRGKKKRGALNI